MVADGLQVLEEGREFLEPDLFRFFRLHSLLDFVVHVRLDVIVQVRVFQLVLRMVHLLINYLQNA
jgi:hypothetical protein